MWCPVRRGGATLVSNVSFITYILCARPPGQPQAGNTPSYAIDGIASNPARPGEPPKEHGPATRVTVYLFAVSILPTPRSQPLP